MIDCIASAKIVIDKLEQAGFETWVVGGCVRDSLMGRVPHDWDLCTAATPEEMKKFLSDMPLLEIGSRHGTVTVCTPDGLIEVTTFRADGEYTDGRRPDCVRFVRDIREDLARRDFTVNAMAFSPVRGLYDPFNGQKDLKNDILRTVGDADRRFQEDGLRILRAVRFVSQFGFHVTAETALAMRRQIIRLDCVSVERIQEEWTKILCGRYVCRALREFTDIIGYFLPELRPMFNCDQQNPHHLYNVWEHTIRAVGQVPAFPILRLAALLHDCGKPACKTVDENGVGHFYNHPAVSREIAKDLLRRLRYPNHDGERIASLVANHDRILNGSKKIIRRALSKLGETQYRDLLALKKGDLVGQGTNRERIITLWKMERQLNDILQEDACLSLKNLAVNGRDMIALGLTGSAIGETLRMLLDAVIEETLPNEREPLLSLARQNITKHK